MARRPSPNYLSMLDVVSCAFGAIVLLLLITKPSVGSIAEDLSEELERLRTLLTSSLAEERDARDLEQELQARAGAQRALAQAEQRALEETERRTTDARADAAIAGELQTALQSLTAEMQRLRKRAARAQNPDVIGGIPADSEYIVFIVDTSGSMARYRQAAAAQMETLLAAYPKVRGVQVMDDMGDYMFPGYRRRWIPDTPALRRQILKRFSGWASYSNSSPVEGIYEAIRTFKENNISLYILGDDFTGPSAQQALEQVAKLNRTSGGRKVRIHAIGFSPGERALRQLEAQQPDTHAAIAQASERFAMLMRAMTRQNGGTLLGVGVDEG